MYGEERVTFCLSDSLSSTDFDELFTIPTDTSEAIRIPPQRTRQQAHTTRLAASPPLSRLWVLTSCDLLTSLIAQENPMWWNIEGWLNPIHPVEDKCRAGILHLLFA